MALEAKEEIYQALRDNRERADGRARAAIAEEIADAAEALGDPEVVVSALVEQISAYYGSGESVKVPVAFARLLRLWDEDPKHFDEYETHRLFWYFKWVTSGLLTTPDVPLASIRGWVEEMERRYTDAEKGMQPVAAQRFHVARHIGQGEDVAYDLWATRGRTRLSDCVDCEARGRAQYWADRGQDERAVTELAAALQGRSNCQEEPQASQAVALLPLTRLGRLDEARTAHLTGYRAVRGREAFVGSVGEHLEFCALSGNEARGLELLAQNRALFSFAGSQLARLEFLVGVEVLLARLDATGHGDAPCGGPVGRDWTVSALLAVVSQEAAALVARFDERNGTNAVSARRARRSAAPPAVVELNLGVRTAVPGAGAEDFEKRRALTAAAAPAAAPLVVPEDFAELVAEARRLDKTGHPNGRELWSAVLTRSPEHGEDIDDRLRGEIAAELAHRAYADKDWDEARRQFQAAAKHYEAAGLPGRVLASEARDVWAEAVADGGDAAASAAAAWPRLDGLLAAVQSLLAEDSQTPTPDRDIQRMALVVRNSRVFVARHAGLAGEGERAAAWADVFKAEADALIEQAMAFDMPGRASLAYELFAEYDATHGEPAAAEAAARRALEIFDQKEWPWRKHRGRLLLALALAGQKRFAEAVDELRSGLAEVYPGTEPDEVTPLHRLLGDVAAQARDHAIAVRAYSEAAVRLEREGSHSAAVETRWRLSTVLFASGQVADAVAVLETLTDEAAEEALEAPAVVGDAGEDAAGEGAAADDSAAVTAAETAANSVAHAAAAHDAAHAATANAGTASAATAVAATDATAAMAPATAGVDSPDVSAATPLGVPGRSAELAVQIRLDLAHGLARLGEYREAAFEYLRVAHVVGSWHDRTLLTFAAGGAARALAFSGQWDAARLALQRALDSNRDAPFIADLSQVLRDLAGAAVEDRGAEAADEALGYVDAADRLRTEYPQAARDQFVSVAFDEAQCLYARGKILYGADRDEEALAAFDRAIGVFDAAGHGTSPARFEAVRAAALVEMGALGRVEAGRARLDRAIGEAEAAGQREGAGMLRQLREGR